ncbi:hypothetical protein M413DRAFT_33125, partial [Hebeloma cylindrosporum]
MPVPIRYSVFTPAERAVINVYKSDYLNAATPEQRKQVAQSKVLPAIFNYWTEQGRDTSDIAIIYWMQNTWRSKTLGDAPPSSFKPKITELVWRTRKADVLAEIAVLLGLEAADTHSPGWFNKRMLAIRNIMDTMSTEEKAALEKERMRIAREGNPEEEKRRLAEKKSMKRMADIALANWLEMGLLTISFVTRTTPDGQLAIEVHDPIPNLLGVPASTFKDLYQAQINEVMRLILEYVKSVKGMFAGSAAPKKSAPTVHIDPSGFPKLPDLLDPSSKKLELERLFR